MAVANVDPFIKMVARWLITLLQTSATHGKRIIPLDITVLFNETINPLGIPNK